MNAKDSYEELGPTHEDPEAEKAETLFQDGLRQNCICGGKHLEPWLPLARDAGPWKTARSSIKGWP